MLERINSPRELFNYQLGAALKMENTALEMLDNLEDAAQSSEVKQQLSHHADETRQHIRNIEQAFKALGQEPDDKPCPAIDGLEKEGKSNIKKANDSLMDAVVLAAAAETEHLEIAVYERLIAEAEAMGQQKITGLLQENLQQEQHTLEEVNRAAQSLAQRQFATA